MKTNSLLGKKLKKLLSIVIMFFCVMCLVSCENDSEDKIEWPFEQKVSYLVEDDGWVYSFSYTYDKGGLNDDALIPYNFMGVNLRYRYNEDYVTTVTYMEDGEKKTKIVPQTIQVLGEANDSGIKNDMEEIADILKYQAGEVTTQELLDLTVDDLTFEELDENIFIELVQAALKGEAHKEGNYDYLPQYALLTEPEYLNDYKFQVGFVSSVGCIDVIFIDVLYRTGNDYDSYKQLSDIIDSGTASDEQKKIYNMIEEITTGIVENNNILYALGEYENENIDNIDFSRLYSFLKEIEANNYYKYIIEPR